LYGQAARVPLPLDAEVIFGLVGRLGLTKPEPPICAGEQRRKRPMRRSPPGRRTNLHPGYDDKGRPGANGDGTVIPWVEKQASAPPVHLARIARTDGITKAADASFLSILSARLATTPHARVQQSLLPGANEHSPTVIGHQ